MNGDERCVDSDSHGWQVKIVKKNGQGPMQSFGRREMELKCSTRNRGYANAVRRTISANAVSLVGEPKLNDDVQIQPFQRFFNLERSGQNEFCSVR